MRLKKKIMLELTPEEKETITKLKDVLDGFCVSSDFVQCTHCPFDRNGNGKCIKAQFFNTLDNIID